MTTGKPFHFTTAPLSLTAACRFFNACSTTARQSVVRGSISALPDPGEFQQVLNQSLHAHRAIDRVSDIFVGLLVQLAAIAFRQQLGIVGNHAQRFLQVVRGYIGKLLQFRIGAGQFSNLLGQCFFRLAPLIPKPLFLQCPAYRTLAAEPGGLSKHNRRRLA